MLRHYSDLKKDQIEAIDDIALNDETILIAPMGAGKTVVTATAVHRLLNAGSLGRVLIAAPILACDTAWKNVWTEWAHLKGLTVAFAMGQEKTRKAALAENADVTVINHENLGWLVKQYRQFPFDGVVCDELSKFRAVGAPTFRALYKIMRKAKWRVGLTGTVVSEDFIGLFAMAKMLDDGRALGTRKDRFLADYFFPTDYMQYNWELREDGARRIINRLRGLCHVIPSYTDTLPPLDVGLIRVELSEETLAAYYEMQKHSVWNGVQAINAATQAGCLKQLACGFIYDNELTHRIGTEKHDAAMAYLKTIDTPVLVIYSYVEELKLMLREFPDAPVIGDGASRRDKQRMVAAFSEGEYPIMFAHPLAFGHGTDGLQDSCYEMLMLSPLWSLDSFDQTVARIWRRGQDREVCVRVIVAEDTIDTSSVLPGLVRKQANEPLFLQLWGEQV